MPWPKPFNPQIFFIPYGIFDQENFALKQDGKWMDLLRIGRPRYFEAYRGTYNTAHIGHSKANNPCHKENVANCWKSVATRSWSHKKVNKVHHWRRRAGKDLWHVRIAYFRFCIVIYIWPKPLSSHRIWRWVAEMGERERWKCEWTSSLSGELFKKKMSYAIFFARRPEACISFQVSSCKMSFARTFLPTCHLLFPLLW